LGHGGSFRACAARSIHEKDHLPIRAIQFDRYIFSYWRRKSIEESTTDRDREWNFSYLLKILGKFNECRRDEAINIQRTLKRGLKSLRITGKKNSDQQTVNSKQFAAHERYYTGGL